MLFFKMFVKLLAPKSSSHHTRQFGSVISMAVSSEALVNVKTLLPRSSQKLLRVIVLSKLAMAMMTQEAF